jgi:uncharacterized membrane protein
VSEVSSHEDAGAAGRHLSALGRVLATVAVGVLTFAIAIFLTPWEVATLIGWSVAAAVFIAWVWRSVAGKDSATTAALATIEDRSRPAADLILIALSGASLVVVALALLEASWESGAAEGFITAVAGVSIV